MGVEDCVMPRSPRRRLILVASVIVGIGCLGGAVALDNGGLALIGALALFAALVSSSRIW